MPCRHLCRLYIHLAFTYILCWSLQCSVERTWMGSAFSTNESAWSVIVTGSQSCVWSGPETPWPLHFKHSRWWKRRSPSKFASHYAGGTNGVMWMQDGCTIYMDPYMASNGSRFVVTWIIFQKSPFGGRPNTKPEDHGTPNAHHRWSILFYHVWGPRMYRNSLT